MNIINADKISHSYFISGRKIQSLKNVSYSIRQGEFVAIIGKNGCGKSTLAKHINVLLPLQSGKLTVAHYDAADKKSVWKIRKNCGMVFQNPDNQFVSSIVEEDIKFGLKNYNLDCSDEAVKKALELAGVSGFEKRTVNSLSGGEKQRVALAGILVIKPQIIIFDEATSMLTPDGRRDIVEMINTLHKETDITIIMISQYVEDVVDADRIIVMNNGKIADSGPPKEILSNKELLETTGLKPPFTVNLYYDLLKAGIKLKECPLTNERLVELLCLLR